MFTWLTLLTLAASAADLRVAVTDFVNASDSTEVAPLGKGLQSMIATDLASSSSVQLLERQQIRDLLAEQDLLAQGRVDAASAAQVGKLLGVTHWVSGSVTVANQQMRIDARLFDGNSGAVVLATSVQGEQDAFFELEKNLVQQLLEALAVELAPRERAELSRIHTADYGAFRAYALGIDLADRDKLDQALEQLARAQQVDARFELAAHTAEQVAELAASIRAEAERIARAQKDEARIEGLAAATDEARVLDQLLEIAAEPGAAAQKNRLTALQLLATGLVAHGAHKPGFRQLHATDDQFAMARLGERAARAYAAEAESLWPTCPLATIPGGAGNLPRVDTFDKDFARSREVLFPESGTVTDRQFHELLTLPNFGRETQRLTYTAFAHQFARMTTQLWTLHPDHALRYSVDSRAASMLTNVLALEQSTRLLQATTQTTNDPSFLRMLALAIETNGQLQQALTGAPAALPEYIRFKRKNAAAQPPPTQRDIQTLAEGGDRASAMIRAIRKWPYNDLVFLGEHPAWALGSYGTLSTGPRSDVRQTEQLRYASEQDTQVWTLLDGERSHDFSLTLRLTDLTPEGTPPANLTFVLGVQDVMVPWQDEGLTRPMKALGLQVTGDTVSLIELIEQTETATRRHESFQRRVIASRTLQRTSDVFTLKVSPTEVSLTAGKRPVSFEADVPVGFYGLRFEGPGSLIVDQLQIKLKGS